MNSSKLVRVSNSRRPLKLISSNGSLEEFELSVRRNYELDNDSVIQFEDDHGAAINAETFPILLSIFPIADIGFKLVGEETAEIAIDLSSQQLIADFSIPSFSVDNSFKQVLDCVIHQNKQISAIVAACNYKGLVDDKAATFLIKEFVFKLVELKGESPSPSDQKQLAVALIDILPCWRYPESKEGLVGF
ncbi:hypothetical protein Fcan01_22415 [Folsomia candida]|uniref:Uncharacterized protein n=1 Tax=Folsomia candida TaxID=158441 RepID=A0A226DCU4_FOLCA|nr:hypothetical protein Fcan01_22415 [Folsomia candida]